MPEADIVFRGGVLAFFRERKVMLDGFAAGILVMDFSLHLVKAPLCFLIPGSERFILFVVISLVLRYMGVLVNAVLYQSCDNVQLIGPFDTFLSEFVIPFFSVTIVEMECEVRDVPDGNVVNLF